MNWFVNNREVVRNLAVNTGTSQAPVYTQFCTTSEVSLAIDSEVKDFYVFCDAIKRSVLTGVTLTLKATVKIDMNNEAIKAMLSNIHAIIENGEIGQLNNVSAQFELLDDVSGGVLTYVKYNVPCVMKIEELGGAAEDEGGYSLELVINGKGTIAQ